MILTEAKGLPLVKELEEKIRDQGIRVESLARIQSMSPEKGVTFCD